MTNTKQTTLDIANYSIEQLIDLKKKLIYHIGQLEVDYATQSHNNLQSLVAIEYRIQQLEQQSKPQETNIKLPKLKKVQPPTLNNTNDSVSPLCDHNPELSVNKKDIANTLDYAG